MNPRSRRKATIRVGLDQLLDEPGLLRLGLGWQLIYVDAHLGQQGIGLGL